MSWRVLGALLFALFFRHLLVTHLGWNYTPFVNPFSFYEFGRDATAFFFLFGGCLALINAIFGPIES